MTLEETLLKNGLTEGAAERIRTDPHVAQLCALACAAFANIETRKRRLRESGSAKSTRRKAITPFKEARMNAGIPLPVMGFILGTSGTTVRRVESGYLRRSPLMEAARNEYIRLFPELSEEASC